MTIYFVSSNEEKFRELRGALEHGGHRVERVALDVAEIQSLDPAVVASAKARAAYAALGQGLVLVEDTGLAIEAWHGYPGALIKWLLGAVGEAGLCRQLDPWDNRRATATVVLCLYDGTAAHIFTGAAMGSIVGKPRGDHGFGWDSIFQPEGDTRTYGEMARAEKTRISMRARALASLTAFLNPPRS